MPLSNESIKNKPYNRCINCSHLGVSCDGPNFLAMEPDRWSEWCRIRKSFLDLTNEEIADRAGLNISTVTRALSGATKDIKFSNMQAITEVLVDGTWGQFPCPITSSEVNSDVAVLQARVAEMGSQISAYEQQVAYLKEQIEFKEKQMKEKDGVIKAQISFYDRKNFFIALLATLFGICFTVLIAFLVFDLITPNIGFIR